MSLLLTQAIHHLEKGLDAQAKNDRKRARFHYLKAAEYLLKYAKEAPSAEKERRTAQAEELIRRAQALEVAPSEQPQAVAEATGAAAWLVVERPKVRFADVAGLEEVKEQIRLKLIYPFTHPELAKKFGIKPGGGILLYGPPGTGKTLIARAVAGEIDAAFFTVKPSEIMSKWVGEAEQNVAKLFASARSYPRSVIFIDEVEALIPRRRDSGSTVMQRVVPQILMELEGFEGKPGNLLFIGATNEPWSLDPAAMRPGRFDEKIYVPLPDWKARRRILELSLQGRPLGNDISLDELATLLEGYSGADIVNICFKACATPFLESIERGIDRDVTMEDFLRVIDSVKPSVSAKELEKFEKFRREA